MRKLNKKELININGGFKLSGAVLQYGRLFVLAFYDIGAYSVTEGIYLFLSRRMPAIVMYSKKNGYRVIRKPVETFLINSSDTQ